MVDIIVSEFMHKQAVADLSRDFEVVYEPTLGLEPYKLGRMIRKTRALIVRDRTPVDVPLIADALELRVVGQIGPASANIDLLACEARGVSVVRAAAEIADAVGEYVVAAAMLLTRGAFLSTGDVAKGNWPRGHLVGREIAGRTLGFAGIDAGARAAARRASALGLRLIGWDPALKPEDPGWQDIRRVSFDDLVAEADILSVHLATVPEHLGRFGMTTLSRLKAGSVLIVVGGGGVVDEAGLANLLSIGRLRGAALDCFETEPLAGEAGRVFAGVPNLVLTPRIADLTLESHLRSSSAIVAKVRAALGA